MAVLHDRSQMTVGGRQTAHSLFGSTFAGRIPVETRVGDRPAIPPEIAGRGWITGLRQHPPDPADPWPEGYRLVDNRGAR